MIGGMFVKYLSSDPRLFFAVVFTVVVSICLHELSHGIVAIWFGDRTPIETGHMTPNPMVHMGGFSFLLLIVAGIAWGQMPVNPSRMRGRYAPACVAIAGPAMNILLAVISLGCLGLWQRHMVPGHISTFDKNAHFVLWIFGLFNVALAIFNLIPIPPLDGSHVLANLVPPFGELLGRLAGGGALGIVFLALFFFASKYIFDGANYASLWFLQHVRGF